MNPVRRRRLAFVGVLLLAVGGATALALTALSQNLNHYYSPTEINEGQAPGQRSFRIGGLVAVGSTVRGNSTAVLENQFRITDCFREVPVRFQGILPDLFKEGQSVIATGRMQGEVFMASEVLAKHDENYMPKEAADAIAKAQTRGADAQCVANAGIKP